MTWTVVGARGFIGSAFVRRLRSEGEDVVELTHQQALAFEGDLGDVVYASGIAWDADKRPDDALRMHVHVPKDLLRKSPRSFVYLSSTRVYGDSPDTEESAPLRVAAGDVYAATKAAGESVVLADPRPAMRVVRLSNVYGASFSSGLMLSDFLRQAATSGKIVVRSSSNSEKDHVSVDDVVVVTLSIARSGRGRIYNVAAGRNTRQGDVLRAIAAASGCELVEPSEAPVVAFAPIDVRRVAGEFGFAARDVLDDIPNLWRTFREHFAARGLSESVNVS